MAPPAPARRLLLVTLVLAGSTGGSLALLKAFQGQSPKSSPEAATNGLIAFTGARNGNSEIIVVRPDGSGMTNLTQHPAADFAPAWSPDGARLAFISNRDGGSDVYVMDVPTGGVTRLTSTPKHEFHARWSPDGTRLAAASWNGSPLIVPADGTGPPVTVGAGLQVESRLSWSPDGTQVTFSASPPTSADFLQDVYVAMADGSGFENLTNDDTEQLDPVWSPDGEWIAFLNDVDRRGGLVAIHPDGSGWRSLVSPEAGLGAAWSPDGNRLAVDWYDRKPWEAGVAVVNADGSGLRVISYVLSPEVLDWSPDGSSIVFESYSDRDTEGGVYVLDLDQMGYRRISRGPSPGASPDWGMGTDVPLPGPTGSPSPGPTAGSSPVAGPTASPTPTQEAIPPDMYPPFYAMLGAHDGYQEGVQEPFCWERVAPRTGKTITDCRDEGGWEPEDALPVRPGENVSVWMGAVASPREALLSLQGPGGTFETRLAPRKETFLRVDVPEGMWHAKLCATWPEHGTVCWRFLLAVSE